MLTLILRTQIADCRWLALYIELAHASASVNESRGRTLLKARTTEVEVTDLTVGISDSVLTGPTARQFWRRVCPRCDPLCSATAPRAPRVRPIRSSRAPGNGSRASGPHLPSPAHSSSSSCSFRWPSASSSSSSPSCYRLPIHDDLPCLHSL